MALAQPDGRGAFTDRSHERFSREERTDRARCGGYCWTGFDSVHHLSVSEEEKVSCSDSPGRACPPKADGPS